MPPRFTFSLERLRRGRPSHPRPAKDAAPRRAPSLAPTIPSVPSPRCNRVKKTTLEAPAPPFPPSAGLEAGIARATYLPKQALDTQMLGLLNLHEPEDQPGVADATL